MNDLKFYHRIKSGSAMGCYIRLPLTPFMSSGYYEEFERGHEAEILAEHDKIIDSGSGIATIQDGHFVCEHSSIIIPKTVI